MIFLHHKYWRRLLVPGTVRRSNQSVLKETHPKYSLEGLCWSSNTLATWCKEPSHWKRLWCWERLRAKGEGGQQSVRWLAGIWLSKHESEQTPGDAGGQRGCGVTGSDMIQWLNNSGSELSDKKHAQAEASHLSTGLLQKWLGYCDTGVLDGIKLWPSAFFILQNSGSTWVVQGNLWTSLWRTFFWLLSLIQANQRMATKRERKKRKQTKIPVGSAMQLHSHVTQYPCPWCLLSQERLNDMI